MVGVGDEHLERSSPRKSNTAVRCAPREVDIIRLLGSVFSVRVHVRAVVLLDIQLNERSSEDDDFGTVVVLATLRKEGVTDLEEGGDMKQLLGMISNDAHWGCFLHAVAVLGPNAVIVHVTLAPDLGWPPNTEKAKSLGM